MHKLKGFTLIEIMIAMAISSIALLAVSELYINTRRIVNLNAIQNRVSEDGRYSIFMLQQIISQAGFRPDPTIAMPADRLTATSNQSITVRFNADGTNQMACDGTIAPAGVTTLVISRPINTNTLQCSTSNIINNVSIFNNVNWITPSGTGDATVLVDFQILYGVDTGPSTIGVYGCGPEAADGNKPRDCVADNYVGNLPTGVTAAQVTSVRVCLVLRSEIVDGSIIKSADAQNCGNVNIANSRGDGFLYRTFRSTILLKNS
jgi:type IV pilus assembly protein PilW